MALYKKDGKLYCSDGQQCNIGVANICKNRVRIYTYTKGINKIQICGTNTVFIYEDKYTIENYTNEYKYPNVLYVYSTTVNLYLAANGVYLGANLIFAIEPTQVVRCNYDMYDGHVTICYFDGQQSMSVTIHNNQYQYRAADGTSRQVLNGCIIYKRVSLTVIYCPNGLIVTSNVLSNLPLDNISYDEYSVYTEHNGDIYALTAGYIQNEWTEVDKKITPASQRFAKTKSARN